MAVELSILSSHAFRAGVFTDIAHVEVRNVAAVGKSCVDVRNRLGQRRKYNQDAELLSPFWGSSVKVWQLSFPFCHRTPFKLAYSLILLMSKCAMLRLLINHVSMFAIVSDNGVNTTNTLSRCPRFGAVAWKYGS